MTLDIDEVMEMYIKSKRENESDKLWQQWLVDFARMDHDNFVSFQDYKDRRFKPKLEIFDKEEILKDAEDIKRLDQKGGI